MNNREEIYYWKCDRKSAFLENRNHFSSEDITVIESSIQQIIKDYFNNNSFKLTRVNSQGNHMFYQVSFNHSNYYIRLENGSENDGYMEVESRIMKEVKGVGVPTPIIYEVDATRTKVPFSYQIMECINYQDLKSLNNTTPLELPKLSIKLGEYIALWQTIEPKGFGPFSVVALKNDHELIGLHSTYKEYFLTNLDKHLQFLIDHKFFTLHEIKEIKQVIKANSDYLLLQKGCLVHKDLALWNVLGSQDEIVSIIDWDDAISGDPMDDISLMACFHPKEFIFNILIGFKRVKGNLPENYEKKFWLHLLRNMIVKAVIRIGEGHFHKKDDFFLIGNGLDGKDLKKFTIERIQKAILGLKHNYNIDKL